MITWRETTDRYHDLTELNRVENDLEQPSDRRLKAKRTKDKIISQLNDKNLQALRARLVRALQSEDQHEAAKLRALIQDYSKEERLYDKYGI